MTKKFPNPESGEQLSLRCVEALKEKGFEDPEVREFFTRWAAEREQAIDSLAGDKVAHRNAQIEFEYERARMYCEAGYVDEALDVLYEAKQIAYQEGLEEWHDKIDGQIEKIR